MRGSCLYPELTEQHQNVEQRGQPGSSLSGEGWGEGGQLV